MSSRSLPDDYFAVGVFAVDGPELLQSYTCVCCGIRHASWKTFRAHRRSCPGHMRDGATFATGSTATIAVRPAPDGALEAEALDLSEAADDRRSPESPLFLPVPPSRVGLDLISTPIALYRAKE
jgi:hypothetical protein